MNVTPSIEIEFGTGFYHEFQYAFNPTQPRQEDQDSLEPSSTIKDLFNATPRSSPSPDPASRKDTPGTLRGLDSAFQHLSVTSNHPKAGESLGSEITTGRHSPSDEPILRETPSGSIPDLNDSFQLLSINLPLQSPGSASPNGIPNVFTPDTQDQNPELGSPTSIISRLAQFSLSSRTAETCIPYKVEHEALPNEPYFDQEFQQALKAARTLTTIISDQLKQCQLTQNLGTNLNRLL